MAWNGYTPRRYEVIKVSHPGCLRVLVVAEDLDDPDVWALINSFATTREAWEYVREIEARNRALAEASGCCA